MRFCLLGVFLISVLSCSRSNVAGGDGVGNGGDGLALTFRKAGEAAIQQAETYDGASPRVDYTMLRTTLEKAVVTSTDDKIEVDGIEVDAKNFPASQKIMVNRSRLIQLEDQQLMQTLALHEILGLAGIPDVNFAKSSLLLRYDPITRKAMFRKVDFLFVIDDSGSMAAHQLNLSNNIDHFISRITTDRVDYHVGITTTSENERCWPKPCKTPGVQGRLVAPFVTPFTPQGLDLIRKNLLVGTSGDGTETPYQQIRNALILNHPENTGFLRSDASLEILVVTDADEQSSVGPADLLALFRQQKPNQSVSVSLFLPLPEDTSCQTDSGSGLIYQRYYDVMGPLHGGLHSLCTMTGSVHSYSLMIHARFGK